MTASAAFIISSLFFRKDSIFRDPVSFFPSPTPAGQRNNPAQTLVFMPPAAGSANEGPMPTAPELTDITTEAAEMEQRAPYGPAWPAQWFIEFSIHTRWSTTNPRNSMCLTSELSPDTRGFVIPGHKRRNTTFFAPPAGIPSWRCGNGVGEVSQVFEVVMV